MLTTPLVKLGPVLGLLVQLPGLLLGQRLRE
jgi:hypothetical protein